MHIVTASDKNYILGVLVLIASAARHNPAARFTVLAVDWGNADLDRLAILATRLNTVIQAIPLTSETFASLDTGRKHHTTAMYARLLIPDLLPDQDRVLYMDSDMVVTGPLDRAWTVNLHGYHAAAVRCPHPYPKTLRTLGLARENYVNSGFLVMNLQSWRAEDIAATCLSALAETPEKFPSQDEAAINYFCVGRILYLPCVYNIYATDFIHENQLCQPQDIRVLHFMMGKKPWVRESAFSPVWYHEAARIAPITRLASGPPAQTFRHWLRRANQHRKIWQARFSIGGPRKRYLRQHVPFMTWVAEITAGSQTSGTPRSPSKS